MILRFRRLSIPLAIAVLGGWLASGGAAPPADAPVLSLPIDCRPGSDCFVQQYFDHDPGPGAKDYRCGSRVYDGHDGLDIRVPTIAAQRRGVAVLAAAPGIVSAVRDGEADHLIGSEVDRAVIRGRECGNGVVITHGGGWLTQYCHLANGSIAVKPGQAVRAGSRIGLVGLSGETQFPHLHLAVRNGSRKIDPFAPDAPPGVCGRSAGAGLWSKPAADALAYRASEIINVGFANGPVTMPAIETEATTLPDPAAPALVFFARAIGLRAGDRMKLQLLDPAGKPMAESATPIDTAKAQWLGFAGRKRPVSGWPRGRYRGSVTVERDGAVALRKEVDFSL